MAAGAAAEVGGGFADDVFEGLGKMEDVAETEIRRQRLEAVLTLVNCRARALDAAAFLKLAR